MKQTRTFRKVIEGLVGVFARLDGASLPELQAVSHDYVKTLPENVLKHIPPLSILEERIAEGLIPQYLDLRHRMRLHITRMPSAFTTFLKSLMVVLIPLVLFGVPLVALLAPARESGSVESPSEALRNDFLIISFYYWVSACLLIGLIHGWRRYCCGPIQSLIHSFVRSMTTESQEDISWRHKIIHSVTFKLFVGMLGFYLLGMGVLVTDHFTDFTTRLSFGKKQDSTHPWSRVHNGRLFSRSRHNRLCSLGWWRPSSIHQPDSIGGRQTH